MMNLMSEYALTLCHRPYIWGGKTISGMDCSGLCCEIARSFGFIGHDDYSAQQLYDLLRQNCLARTPAESALVFFGKDTKNINHVGYCITDKLMVESGSGDHTTTTPQMSEKMRAFSRIRPINHRKDLVACLRLYYPG